MYTLRSAFIFFVSAVLLLCLTPALSGETLDFAVIQPGQPGTCQEAQPVMDALADYLGKKMGNGISIRGRYFNEVDRAVNFLKGTPPAWGIVRLGFYLKQARRFGMTALTSTRPGGYDKDVWRLVVKRDFQGRWESIRGKVLGNMLFETEAAACLLFGRPPERLPFALTGTFRPLRALRRVMRGKAAGAVLDGAQYRSLEALPLFKQVKVVHESGDLPKSPVVWFGPTDERSKRLTGVLMAMKEDKDAEVLLKLLQTDGFGPADRDLSGIGEGKRWMDCLR
ncbi:MAG TPA: hypothetical protein ENH37_08825 [Deltaproteobacteria bacterium]|nr:hypothetical protein [Deltaproteobacteria bacterium]